MSRFLLLIGVFLLWVFAPSYDRAQLATADLRSGAASSGSRPLDSGELRRSSAPRDADSTDRIVVRYVSRADAGRARARILERFEDTRSAETLKSANAEVFLVEPSAVNTVRTIERVPGVKYAEKSYRGVEAFSLDDGYYERGRQWAPRQVGAEKAWDLARGDIGRGPDIGLLTTGYLRHHPELRGQVVSEHDCGAEDRRANPIGVHGTHVVGIAGAAADNGRGIAGIAPEADLFVGQVLTKKGELLAGNVVECGDLAMKRDVKVIGMSLGFLRESRLLRQAVKRWRNHGINVVASAGNYGWTTHRRFGRPIYPAASDGVIGVGATGQNGGRWPASGVGGWVDVAAPGKEIVSTSFKKGGNPTYESFSGTSQAAPHVVGALACARARGKSRIDAERDMFERAYDRGPPGRDEYFGHGALNMFGAVRG